MKKYYWEVLNFPKYPDPELDACYNIWESDVEKNEYRFLIKYSSDHLLPDILIGEKLDPTAENEIKNFIDNLIDEENEDFVDMSDTGYVIFRNFNGVIVRINSEPYKISMKVVEELPDNYEKNHYVSPGSTKDWLKLGFRLKK